VRVEDITRLTARDQLCFAGQEAIRVEQSGGFVSDNYLGGELLVSRAFGDFHTTTCQKLRGLSAVPDIMQTLLRSEDEFLILTCDGVTDVLDEAEVTAVVRKALIDNNHNAEVAAQKLIEHTLRHPTENLSAIVVTFSPSLDPPPASSTRNRLRTESQSLDVPVPESMMSSVRQHQQQHHVQQQHHPQQQALHTPSLW